MSDFKEVSDDEQAFIEEEMLMLASHYLGHSKMMNKNCSELQEILWQEHSINYNNYPAYFKRGTFLRRELVLVEPENLKDIPEKYRPTKPIERHVVRPLDMWLSKTINGINVIFDGEEPVTLSL